MNLTKKTIVTWDTISNYPPLGFQEAWGGALDIMIKEGKTDGKRLIVNPNVNVRYWIDEKAALEWKSIIENIAQKWSVNLVSVMIEDA